MNNFRHTTETQQGLFQYYFISSGSLYEKRCLAVAKQFRTSHAGYTHILDYQHIQLLYLFITATFLLS